MNHFLCVNDCTVSELESLLKLSAELKVQDKAGTLPRILDCKILAMVFEKASLRTRMSFQIAMADLGGMGMYLKPEDIGIMGEREPIKDMARVFGRYVHGIMARTFAHDTLLELADYAGVPVINALSWRFSILGILISKSVYVKLSVLHQISLKKGVGKFKDIRVRLSVNG